MVDRREAEACHSQNRSIQLAKERLRQIESRLAQGIDDPLPSRTPIPEIIAAYVRQVRLVKTAKSAQTDVYYLRQMFGPCCSDFEITIALTKRAS